MSPLMSISSSAEQCIDPSWRYQNQLFGIAIKLNYQERMQLATLVLGKALVKLEAGIGTIIKDGLLVTSVCYLVKATRIKFR